jgi:hypothetical protein
MTRVFVTNEILQWRRGWDINEIRVVRPFRFLFSNIRIE